jgi:hypothetical protein
VSDQKQVWIKCQVELSNQVLPIGFCERLLADFAKATGHEVNLDEAIADDLLGWIVIVDQVSCAPCEGNFDCRAGQKRGICGNCAPRTAVERCRCAFASRFGAGLGLSNGRTFAYRRQRVR